MANQRARSKIASGTLVVLVAATLPGCFPYLTSYVYLDGPGVTYKRSPCYDGAPVGVAYEKNSVRFEVTLEPHALSPLKQAYLKVRAPRSAAISIPEPTALITFRGQGKPTSVHLQAAPLDWQGPYVEEMRRKSPLAEYRFVFIDLPSIDSPGTLKLPIVVADGAVLESPIFTFERRSYAGIVPLNC
jgi:hypothetical protein